MHHDVTYTKTTLAADEILQCHCRAGESWPANCSIAAVQRLQSSGRQTVCWSVEHNTCRRWPIVAGDGLHEKRADSHR